MQPYQSSFSGLHSGSPITSHAFWVGDNPAVRNSGQEDGEHMHTTNYLATFIEVAQDCPIEKAEIPPLKNGIKTIASIQYEIIINNPYKYTSDDVIFKTFVQKNNIETKNLEAERIQFFSKGQACLRSSPLTKRYGWGIHSDKDGKVAIYPMESIEYKEYCSSKSLKHLKGMRSKRI